MFKFIKEKTAGLFKHEIHNFEIPFEEQEIRKIELAKIETFRPPIF